MQFKNGVIIYWVKYFIVWFDQQTLHFIAEQREIGVEYQKWVSKLMGYDFEIKFKSRATNQAVDALSHNPSFSMMEICALLSHSVVPWDQLQAQVDGNPFLCSLKQQVLEGSVAFPSYSIQQDRLLYKGRIVLPPSSPLIKQLLSIYHYSVVEGHNSKFKTYVRLAEQWFWVRMRKQVAQYVRECSVCQQH